MAETTVHFNADPEKIAKTMLDAMGDVMERLEAMEDAHRIDIEGFEPIIEGPVFVGVKLGIRAAIDTINTAMQLVGHELGCEPVEEDSNEQD